MQVWGQEGQTPKRRHISGEGVSSPETGLTRLGLRVRSRRCRIEYLNCRMHPREAIRPSARKEYRLWH